MYSLGARVKKREQNMHIIGAGVKNKQKMYMLGATMKEQAKDVYFGC